MADYYPLIARAVAGLDASATGEQRRALYERARSALIAQLRGVQPPLSESDITRERLTLEEAIRKVEQESAQRSRAAARGETRGGGRGDLLRSTQPSINPDAPAQAERDRRNERTRAAREIARARRRRAPERDSLLPSARGPPQRPAPRATRETRPRRRARPPARPGLAQRRDASVRGAIGANAAATGRGRRKAATATACAASAM